MLSGHGWLLSFFASISVTHTYIDCIIYNIYNIIYIYYIIYIIIYIYT